MNSMNKETKLMINSLTFSQNELKAINKQKTQYMIDLHYKGISFIDKNINEREICSLIEFFITMYGFMSYYYRIEQNNMSERSKNYIIENLQSVTTPETFNILNHYLLSKDDTNNLDARITKLFDKSFKYGQNLAPHCNKKFVEERYLRLLSEYKDQKKYSEERIEKTGNSRQLKKIAANTKKHLIEKNRNY